MKESRYSVSSFPGAGLVASTSARGVHHRRPRRLPAVISGAVMLMFSCSTAKSTDPKGDGEATTPRILPALSERVTDSPKEFAGLAWPTEGSLVVGLSRPSPGSPVKLWSLDARSGDLLRLPLRDDADCRRTQFMNPVSMSGGIGLIEVCDDDIEDPSVPTTYSLLRYDLEKRLASPLILDRSIGYLGSFTVPTLAVNQSEDAALLGVGNGLCGTLVWVLPEGLRYITVRIGDSDRAWELDEFFTTSERLCTAQGIAEYPTWSPVEDEVAFFASHDAIGAVGLDRLDVSWNLYLMDTKSLEPRPVLSGITHPQGLEWSPDGRWLTFGGELSQHGEGTWLFEPRTGEILRLTEEIMRWLAWSPDGTRIAAIQGTYASSGDIDDIRMSEVIVFELSSI